MVKILLDQNIPAPIADWLQERVGDAAEITSTRMLGTQRMTDQQLFQLCQSQKMVIVTYDEDFQNPLVISKTPGYGVVRLNVYPTGLKQTKEALLRLLESYSIEVWERASIVVDTEKIRYQKKN
jgi:predicted nuclease of predicted toxin-antitoxin system